MKRRSFLRSMLGLWIGSQLPELDIELPAPAQPIETDLLGFSPLDLDALIRAELQKRWNATMEKQFLYGDGSEPPRGILTVHGELQ